MKVNKIIKLLIVPFVSTTIALPIGCSCNEKKNNVEIVDNSNIKIYLEFLKVGETMQLKYELDDSYCFDVKNSMISFKQNSDASWQKNINLIQCEIDSESKTISVPAEYVIGEYAKIDIKATRSTCTKVNEQEYITAWNKACEINNNRKCIYKSNQQIYDLDDYSLKQESEWTIKALGSVDSCEETKTSYSSNTQTKNEMYCEPSDDGVGYDTYCNSNLDGENWSPRPTSYSSEWFGFIQQGMGIDKFTNLKFDDLLDCYYFKRGSLSTDLVISTVKFNSNKNLSEISYYKNYNHEETFYTGEFDFNSSPQIQKPILKKVDENFVELYNVPNDYEYIENIGLTLHTKNYGIGKFVFPSAKYKWDQTQPLIIMGVNTYISPIIYNNSKKLVLNEDYVIQDGLIQISQNRFNPDSDIIISSGSNVENIAFPRNIWILQ